MISTGANVRPIKLGAAIKPAAVTDQERDSEERRRLYHSARWLRMRASFLAEHPLCVDCHRRGKIVAASVVDHKHGHRSAAWRDRFFDTDGWQALCLDCHAAKSAAELGEWTRSGGSRN